MSLSNAQVLLLQAIAKAPKGLTREQIGEKSGVTPTIDTLGPVNKDTLGAHPDSLYGQKLISVSQDEGEEPLYKATPKGTTAAKEHSARVRMNGDDRVPPKALDAAVLKVRQFRTYGLELFTEADIAEVKRLLGPKYAKVPAEHLKQQIVNRRKQGAYTDPKVREQRRKVNEIAAAVKALWAGEGSIDEIIKAIKAGMKKKAAAK